MKYLLILAFIPCIAFAHEDDNRVTQNGANVTQITNVTNVYQQRGVASAIAMSQLHYDGATHQPQIAIGVGNYSGESALAIGAARKLGATGPLVSFSASRDSSHTGVGVGITFRL